MSQNLVINQYTYSFSFLDILSIALFTGVCILKFYQFYKNIIKLSDELLNSVQKSTKKYSDNIINNLTDHDSITNDLNINNTQLQEEMITTIKSQISFTNILKQDATFSKNRVTEDLSYIIKHLHVSEVKKPLNHIKAFNNFSI